MEKLESCLVDIEAEKYPKLLRLYLISSIGDKF